MTRLRGAEADEVSALCRPLDASDDALGQAESVYQGLATTLGAEGASVRHLAGEIVYLRDVGRDLPHVLAARARILAEGGQSPHGSFPIVIQQAPAEQSARCEVFATALLPHRDVAWSARDLHAASSCSCEGCMRSGARRVRLGSRTSIHTSNLYGEGRDVVEQATAMFHVAERLLGDCGVGFRDVVRTWIYLRDIDRDYEALNHARRAFFASSGIELRPASTGVGGIPFPDRHHVTMTLLAVRADPPLVVHPMSTPSLNEAWTYGADFSRGLRVTDTNRTTLYVSGTASIDEAGHTAHVGDLGAQAERMLHNIETLLAGQGASTAHVLSGVTYVRDAADAAAVREVFRRRGFTGFPCPIVHARLCRPELLCETEVVAALPLESPEA